MGPAWPLTASWQDVYTMSTAVMFSSRKWRRMAMALQPQQLSSSMVTPGAKRGRAGHRQHLAGSGRGFRDPESDCPCQPLRYLPRALPWSSPYSASRRQGPHWASPSPRNALPASPLGCSSLTGGFPGLGLCRSYALLASSSPVSGVVFDAASELSKLPTCSRPPDAPIPPFWASGPVGSRAS